MLFELQRSSIQFSSVKLSWSLPKLLLLMLCQPTNTWTQPLGVEHTTQIMQITFARINIPAGSGQSLGLGLGLGWAGLVQQAG